MARKSRGVAVSVRAWRACAPANASPWSVAVAIPRPVVRAWRAEPTLPWRLGGAGRENELTTGHHWTLRTLVRQAASEMRTIRSLTRKSEGIHAGKRCMTMTVAGWSKAVKSAAL